MTQEQNRKSLRQFQCRDYLWEIFEQMSTELDCSVDYLINDAMRAYAKSRSYGARGGRNSLIPGGPPGQGSAPPAPAPPPAGAATTAPLGSRGPVPAAAPAPLPRGGGHAPFGATYGNVPTTGYLPPYGKAEPAPPAYAPPAYQPPAAPYQGAPLAGPPGAQSTNRPAMQSAPPPLPTGRGAAPAPMLGGLPPLSVIFNGQKVPIAKEEFVIGRGSKTADLPIKDGNISRRHAAVVWQNGAFWMKDLGSTNGIEYQGRRVDSRRIEEGDIYQICDYELRFTYR